MAIIHFTKLPASFCCVLRRLIVGYMSALSQRHCYGSGLRCTRQVFDGVSKIVSLQNEPPHDKTNKMTLRPAKTPISPG